MAERELPRMSVDDVQRHGEDDVDPHQHDDPSVVRHASDRNPIDAIREAEHDRGRDGREDDVAQPPRKSGG